MSLDDLEQKFCVLSYKEIAELIKGDVHFLKPLEQIPKQEIFVTAYFDGGEEFLARVKRA